MAGRREILARQGRSGVRADDGKVVFALPAAQVRVDDWGCSCVLSCPLCLGLVNRWTRAVQQEMLRHCRIALIHSRRRCRSINGDEVRSAARSCYPCA